MDHILVLLIVLLAAGYLILHFSNQFSSKRNCGGGCKSCAFAEPKKKQ